MSVNGITGIGRTYQASQYTGTKKTHNSSKKATGDAAAVYEKGSSRIANPTKVNQMKIDMSSRLNDMQNLVTTMFKKQGIAIGTADEMWRKLASGDFTADADTIAKAKEDISEDGYWGVKQTSERMFDFAKALAGDDPEKMKKMQDAIEKGFKEATKTWGRTMPDITQDTHDAVTKLFEDYYASKTSE